jgi:predicted nucleic acid-binding Zn ribbon protein
MDRKKRQSNEVLLSYEVKKIIKGLKENQKKQFKYWEEVVGEKLSGIAQPIKDKKGILYVKVPDSVWRFELSMRKDELKEKINQHLNKQYIKEIIFL